VKVKAETLRVLLPSGRNPPTIQAGWLSQQRLESGASNRPLLKLTRFDTETT
jgi:hypothetical protein